MEGAGARSPSEQSPYAPALLNLFNWVLESPGYVQRLKKHYQLFRTAVDEEFAKAVHRSVSDPSQINADRFSGHYRVRPRTIGERASIN